MSGKGKKESKVPAFLPPEAAKFAKQLGLDIHGLEPEAQHLWNHLEKLSTESPVEYERFIAEQMSAAKEGSDAEKNDKGGRAFRPTAEFVIETKTFDGDGTMVREVTGRAVEGKPLYINICSSDLIEVPKDKTGKPIDSTRSVADGLEIPLLIGPVRPFSEQYNAIDVIFHPLVPQICREERYFRGQILELAQDWILQETNVKFKKNSYEDIAIEIAKYKGGLGDKSDIPVLFNIDDAMAQQNDLEQEQQKQKQQQKTNSNNDTSGKKNDAVTNKTNEKSKSQNLTSGNVLSSTDSLLKELQKNKEGSTINEMKTISTTIKREPESKSVDKNNGKEKKKTGPMIQEVGDEKSSLSSPVEETKKSVSFSDVPSTTAPAATKVSSTLTSTAPKKEELTTIREKKYKEPSKFEKQSYQEILDHFENPDAYNPFDNMEVDDPEAALIKDLAKMLAPEQVPNILQNLTPPQPPTSTTSATSLPPATAASALKADSKTTSPTPPTSSSSSIVLSNSHPDIVPVKYSFDPVTKQYTIEITGIKSTASMESLELISSKNEIQIKSDVNIFEKSSSSSSSSTTTNSHDGGKIKIQFQAENEKKIIKEKVKASWKKKIQTLYITVPIVE